MDELFEEPKPQLGFIILQSAPLTKEEGQTWLAMVANCLPSEIFTQYSWVPFTKPDETN